MEELISQVVKLTGQKVPFRERRLALRAKNPFEYGGIGFRQFNELLLSLGYDRVTRDFFVYLFNGMDHIANIEVLKKCVDEFRKKAMLKYGNFKFAFKNLSRQTSEIINREMAEILPISETRYQGRSNAVFRLRRIRPQDAYYLGYLVQEEIEEDLARAKREGEPLEEVIARMKKMEIIREKGRYNHYVYLTYDYIDVYIATSMRQAFEFFHVGHFIKRLFRSEQLKDLNLRWFDPTQAYCDNRIDKGLVEGLMLKRSSCTIYLAQEVDTLGKDSELAATLAQGKPVIAYVPQLDEDEFRQDLEYLFNTFYRDRKTFFEFARDLVQQYYPKGIWEDEVVRKWFFEEGNIPDENTLYTYLYQKASAIYDVRAKSLKQHPLGLQVNLYTGVANGVLVARTIEECATLLRKVLLRSLEFEVVEEENGPTRLREKVSKSDYRVVTADDVLTNSFWNFYLKESDS